MARRARRRPTRLRRDVGQERARHHVVRRLRLGRRRPREERVRACRSEVFGCVARDPGRVGRTFGAAPTSARRRRRIGACRLADVARRHDGPADRAAHRQARPRPDVARAGGDVVGRAAAARRHRSAVVARLEGRGRPGVVPPPHRVLRSGARDHARGHARGGVGAAERDAVRSDRRPALARRGRDRAVARLPFTSATPTSTGTSPGRSSNANRSAGGRTPSWVRVPRRADRTTSLSSAHGCRSGLRSNVAEPVERVRQASRRLHRAAPVGVRPRVAAGRGRVRRRGVGRRARPGDRSDGTGGGVERLPVSTAADRDVAGRSRSVSRSSWFGCCSPPNWSARPRGRASTRPWRRTSGSSTPRWTGRRPPGCDASIGSSTPSRARRSSSPACGLAPCPVGCEWSATRGRICCASSPREDVTVLAGPVLATGRRELLTVLREQAVSRTRHRFGHLQRQAGA